MKVYTSKKIIVPCKNSKNHTPCPKWQLQWQMRADEMIKTHKQVKCKDCDLYVIWNKREVSLNERRRISYQKKNK